MVYCISDLMSQRFWFLPFTHEAYGKVEFLVVCVILSTTEGGGIPLHHRIGPPALLVRVTYVVDGLVLVTCFGRVHDPCELIFTF